MVATEPIETSLDRALSWHEAFRRLGFSSEDIFLALNAAGPVAIEICIELRQGERSFTAQCGFTKEEAVAVAELWKKKVLWWNSDQTSDTERQKLYVLNFSPALAAKTMRRLTERGFQCPALQVGPGDLV